MKNYLLLSLLLTSGLTYTADDFQLTPEEMAQIAALEAEAAEAQPDQENQDVLALLEAYNPQPKLTPQQQLIADIKAKRKFKQDLLNDIYNNHFPQSQLVKQWIQEYNLENMYDKNKHWEIWNREHNPNDNQQSPAVSSSACAATPSCQPCATPPIKTMTEEEQLEYVLRLSAQDAELARIFATLQNPQELLLQYLIDQRLIEDDQAAQAILDSRKDNYNFNKINALQGLSAEQKDLIANYIESLSDDEFRTLQAFAHMKKISLEKLLLLHLLAFKGPISIFSTKTTDGIEGTSINQIIDGYLATHPKLVRSNQTDGDLEQHLHKLFNRKAIKPALSQATKQTQTSNTRPTIQQRPVPAPRTYKKPELTGNQSSSLTAASQPTLTRTAPIPAPKPITISAKPTTAANASTPQTTSQKPTVPVSLTQPTTVAAAATAQTAQPTIPRGQPVVASENHPMFAHLDEYQKIKTLTIPNQHVRNWIFPKYLPALTPTVAQQNNIQSYITNLSANDYRYLALLAAIKSTTPEYILTAYDQKNGSLNSTIPVIDILAWYLKTYPASTQTSQATIALEARIHASLHQSGIMNRIQDLSNAAKKWWWGN